MLVACCFMEIKNYERSKEFQRNEAVYVLYRIDKVSLDDICARFQLAVEEIQAIIEVHATYEKAVMRTYS
jgi:hypothetical protein